MSLVTELIEKQKTVMSQKGRIWLHVLIEYDLNGNASIVQSYTGPAKGSGIKKTKKQKKAEEEKIVIDSTIKTKTELF